MCLTGCLPWQKAALDDPRYNRYISWHSSAIPLKRQPKLFKLISSKAQRLFKKYLEPKPEKRPAGLAEVHRYMDDRWMSKVGIEKNNEVPAEEEGLCPSMYSFHSSPEEKNKLLFSLTQYGLETTVDRSAKKDRIRQWIQASVIEEEEEEEYETDEDIILKDKNAGPIGERVNERGPISERKLKSNVKKERRYSTSSIRRSPEIYRPPIDPRIPLEKQNAKRISPIKDNIISIQTTQNGYTERPEQKTTIENGIVNGFGERKGSFNLQSVLPFQNLSLERIANVSIPSLLEVPLQHKINVQIPQSEKVINVRNQSIFKTGNEHYYSNGNVSKNDKMFRTYNFMGKGSSSSNSKGRCPSK